MSDGFALITFLNDSSNHSSYNGAFRNCSDFVRTTVNRFYPHAIHRTFALESQRKRRRCG